MVGVLAPKYVNKCQLLLLFSGADVPFPKRVAVWPLFLSDCKWAMLERVATATVCGVPGASSGVLKSHGVPTLLYRANTAQVNFRTEGSTGRHEPYANIQTLDSRFVEERFNEPATLWDSQYVLLDNCGDWDNWECEVGCDEPTKGALKSLHAAAGGCSGGFKPAKLWDKLDQNSLLAMAAVDRIISHGDSWCGNGYKGKNYLLTYGHTSEKFQLIPWSTDTAFQDWWGNPGKNSKTWYACDLMKDCLKNQQCEDDYDAAYSRVVGTIRASRQELLDYIALASSQENHKDDMLARVIKNL